MQGNIVKRAVALIISMIILVSCNSSVIHVEQGGYIEKSIQLPDFNREYGRVIEMLQTDEGKLQLYVSNDEIETYELQSDDTWKSIQVQWLEENKSKINGAVLDIAQDEGGNYYLIYMNDSGKCGVQVIEKNGGIEEVKLAWPDEIKEMAITHIEVVGKDKMFLANEMGKVYQFDIVDGNYVNAYQGGASFAVVNDKLYVTSTSINELVVYDINSGDEKETIATDQIDQTTELLVQENKLYFINQNGICCLTEKDNKWERIMDSQRTSLGIPSLKLEQIKGFNDKFYAIFLSTTGEIQFRYYEYSKAFTTKTTDEISVYMLEDNLTIKQVISQYEIDHPEIKINLEVGVSENQTREDAIRSLNTQLLAGKGPDVLVLDGLPIDTYMEKGILMDMKPWIEEGLSQGTWIENIITAYEKENKVMALPTHFTVLSIWGDRKIVEEANTLDELTQYVLAHPEENIMVAQNANQMIRQLSNMYCTSWFDSEGQLDKGNIQTFLENIKVLARGKEVDYSQGNSFGGANYQEIIHVAYDDAKVWLMKPLNIQDLLLAFTSNRQRGDGDYAMFVAESNESFEPTSILGVNSNSKKQEIAREMIETALSQDIQVVDTKEGFPIHLTALEEWGKGKGINKSQGSYYFTGTQTLSVDWGYEDEINDFITYCKTVQYPDTADMAIVDLIIEESASYFSGQISIEETIRRLEQKIGLYLQE